MQTSFRRIKAAVFTIPCASDWLQAVSLLLLFALVYLPLGLGLGFLHLDVQLSWQTVASVSLGAFFMPALLEELGFRVRLLPHPTESNSPSRRWHLSGLSWLFFVAYHLHPFVPSFFRTLAFLIGAGLLGLICTLSYLKSGSLWMPVVLHWSIVVVWLLVLGGLKRFHG